MTTMTSYTSVAGMSMRIEHNENLPCNGSREKQDTLNRIVAKVWEERLDLHTETNVDYEDRHFRGDMDIMGIRENYLFINETKSNHYEGGFLQAMNQLAKAYTHAKAYMDQDKIFTTYTSTDAENRVQHLWVPRKDMPNKYEKQLPHDLREDKP